MDAAGQLNIEPGSASAMDQFHAGTPLESNQNPFTSGAPGSRLGRPVQIASGELVRLIGLRTPVVVVLGNAGTGKTVLVSMVARACADMGLSVCRIERGDLLTEAAGDASDVLFVDEADSMSNAVLQSVLTARDRHADRTIVFLCLPSSISRFNFSGTDAVVLELSPLSFLDARLYLTGRGNSIGRPDLFTPQALDVVIDASKGVPRLLRSIASLGYFNAAVAGAPQIDVIHAEAAARMRNEFAPAPGDAPHASPPSGKAAQTSDRPELQALHSESAIAVASPDAGASVPETELASFSRIEFFGRMESARDRSLRDAKNTVALGILLLIAGGGSGFALMSGGHTPPNSEPQVVSRPAAIAAARPADTAISPRSSETPPIDTAAPSQSSPAVPVVRPAKATASQASNERPSAVAAAPTQSGPASTSASTDSAPRLTATKVQNTRREHLRAARIVTQSQGASHRRPAPRQIALPGKATLPSYGAVAAPQRTPAEPVPMKEGASPPAQSPSELPPPVVLQPGLPALAAAKVRTQRRGEIARVAQDADERDETVGSESDHTPVIIFGYRLW